ncbi:MAG: hypothetical protein BJ554DRAFT_5074, partial [Olpidium bornovanus]
MPLVRSPPPLRREGETENEHLQQQIQKKARASDTCVLTLLKQAAATTKTKNAPALRSTLPHFNKLSPRYYLPFSKVSPSANPTEDRNETTMAITQAIRTLVPVLALTLGHDREGGILVPRQTRSRASLTTYRIDNYFRVTNISDTVEVDVVVGKLVGDAAIFWLKHNKTH